MSGFDELISRASFRTCNSASFHSRFFPSSFLTEAATKARREEGVVVKEWLLMGVPS